MCESVLYDRQYRLHLRSVLGRKTVVYFAQPCSIIVEMILLLLTYIIIIIIMYIPWYVVLNLNQFLIKDQIMVDGRLHKNVQTCITFDEK